MPDTGWLDASGFGSASLNGGINENVLVVLVEVTSITNPKIRIFGTTFPRRLLYAGSFQLLTHDVRFSGADANVPCFDFPCSFEMFEFLVPAIQYGSNGCRDIAWQLPPGITAKVKVFW